MHYSTYQVLKKSLLHLLGVLAFVGLPQLVMGQNPTVEGPEGDTGPAFTACSGSTFALTANCPTGVVKWSEPDMDDILTLDEVLFGTNSFTVTCINAQESSVIYGSAVITIEGVECDPVVEPPIVSGEPDPIAINTFSLCAGSSLTLTASCAQNNFPVWPNGDRTYELIVLPGVNTYDVVCSDEVNNSEPVTVTVIGGCVEEDLCPFPPSASSLQASGTLSAENCSVRLTGTASGKYFEFTGPGGYVFSAVYRNCQQDLGIYANDVKLPGIYTLKVDGGGLPVTYTIEVGGTACPK